MFVAALNGSAPDHPMPAFPILVLRAGAVPLNSLRALYADTRLELFSADEMTSDWLAFAHRVAGVVIASEHEPTRLVRKIISSGVRTPVVLVNASNAAPESLLLETQLVLKLPLPVDEGCIAFMAEQLSRSSPLLGAAQGLLLDPIARTARNGDRVIQLTQREFALLHVLCGRCGSSVPWQELTAEVWSGAAGAGRRSLEFYICQLRRKFARIGLADVIVTQRGVGYALRTSARIARDRVGYGSVTNLREHPDVPTSQQSAEQL